VPEAAGHVVFGGPEGDAQLIEAKADAEGTGLTASLRAARVTFRLKAPGRHMAMNALAVLAAVDALGLDVTQAAGFLNGFTPFAGRGARRRLRLPAGEVLLLDESYNASGASMRAALAVLGLQPGRRVAVLGDMLELGEFAQDEHLALRPAVLEGADILFACGPGCGALFDSLPPAMQGATAADAPALAPMVAAGLRNGDAVLVKGSHGSNMRAVIRMLEGAEG
jgi:UDP-N-acetylmuramoyl-tripeptide--D-alanyl-D-alanine ligase